MSCFLSSFALIGILMSMWERLCGVLLAKYRLYILTCKSDVGLSFLLIDFLLNCNLGQDRLLILLSSALNGIFNVYFKHRLI